MMALYTIGKPRGRRSMVGEVTSHGIGYAANFYTLGNDPGKAVVHNMHTEMKLWQFYSDADQSTALIRPLIDTLVRNDMVTPKRVAAELSLLQGSDTLIIEMYRALPNFLKQEVARQLAAI